MEKSVDYIVLAYSSYIVQGCTNHLTSSVLRCNSYNYWKALGYRYFILFLNQSIQTYGGGNSLKPLITTSKFAGS